MPKWTRLDWPWLGTQTPEQIHWKTTQSLWMGTWRTKIWMFRPKEGFFFERRRQFQLNPCWDVPPNARTSSLKRSLKSAKVSMLLRDFNSKWMMKSCVLYGLYVWCQWSVYVWICLYVFCFLMETFVSAFSLPTCKKEVVHVSHTGKGQRGKIRNLGLPFQGIFVSSKEGYMKGLLFLRVG